MDVDSYIRANQPVWARLDELTARAGRGVGRLSAAELDELVKLYLRVSTHLSYARTFYRDPALTASLTGRVARSGAVVYGTRSRTLRAVGRFFAVTFPAALWHVRHFVLVSVALLFVPALAFGIWIANSPAALEATGPEAVREAYVQEDFEDYYSSAPAAAFASQVFTNNVRVAILAFAGGIAFCLLTAAILIMNGAQVGVAAGLFVAVGEAPKFWGLILPHGLLELTAVCVAGRRRTAPGLDPHRPRRPAPGGGPGGGGPAGDGHRPRPGGGLRRGRDDRGLRDRLDPAHLRPGRRRGDGGGRVPPVLRGAGPVGQPRPYSRPVAFTLR